MTHLIAGKWISGLGEKFQSISPYNSDVIWQGHCATLEEVNQAVFAAREAFIPWKKQFFDERKVVIEKFAELLNENLKLIATVISKETGKPFWEAKTEVLAMIAKAEVSIKAYHERTPFKERETAGNKIVLRHRPLGVVAVFGPYNFPGHLPNGHIIPALLAGNTVVLKPSEYTPWVSEVIVKLWQKAGLPDGVINVVQGNKHTGEALAVSSGIDGILFTGSASTGLLLHRQLAGETGKALALEMGGNNPMIISKSFGDLDSAIYTIIQSAFISGGQRCTCARRLYIPNGAEGDKILNRLVDVTQTIVIDDPFAEKAPFMGAQISIEAANAILSTQTDLISLGGKVLLKAKKLDHAFISPSIVDVTEIKTLPDEEYFGPLLQVIRYDTLEQAVILANNTCYGLSAGLISMDNLEWDYFVEHIRAGIVNRNRQLTGASGDAPFGGVGLSGNMQPSAYYAADYCAYPMASIEGDECEIPDTLPPGLIF